VLLLLAYGPRRRLPAEWVDRAGLGLGLLVFAAVALGVKAGGARLLEYRQGAAGALILLVEAAATLSIGLALAALVLGGRPSPVRPVLEEVVIPPEEEP
jgi:hypothetical protein